MTKKETALRYLLLVIGVFFIGLGIALAKRSDLGISPVSSVANVLSIRFPFFTVGTWLMLWNCLMIMIQLAILRRAFKPIQFLQFPISLLLGVFTDLCVAFVAVIPAEVYVVRLALVLGGVFVLAFGISLMLISDTVMNVGEALVDVLAKLIHKPFGSVKVVFDITCVALSVVLSLWFFDFTVVGTREGTIITACCTGLVVKWLTVRIKEPVLRLIK